HDVGGFDVAVTTYSFGIGVFHPITELNGPAQTLNQSGRVVLQIAIERAISVLRRQNEFYSNVKTPVDLVDVISSNQIRMAIQVDPRPGFFLEQVDGVFVLYAVRQECLQCVDIVAAPFGGKIYDAESAATELLINLILAQDIN